MGKTPAERQKAYRERKQLKEGDSYRQRETERVKAYYVPVSELSNKKAEERRVNNRKYVQRHRQKKKEQSNASKGTSEEIQCSEISSSSSTKSSTSANALIAGVRLLDPKKNIRNRISRATSKSRRKLEKLEQGNQQLTRNYKRVSKRLERLRKSLNPSTTTANISISDTQESENSTTMSRDSLNALTPRKRAYQELEEEGLPPAKVPKKIKEKIILANTLCEEIGETYKTSNETGKTIVTNLITSKNLQKYRLVKKLSRETGIKHTMLIKKYTGKSMKMKTKRTRNQKIMESIRTNVKNFFSRDDNSRVMPGKNDKVKVGGLYAQKHVLNDSLRYLHLKFNAETTRKISSATFCRMRPKNFSLTKYLSRNKCLCQKHQNMALTLKTMKNAGSTVTLNPDDFVRKLGKDE